MGRGGLQALCRRARGKERACRQKGILSQTGARRKPRAFRNYPGEVPYEPIRNNGLFEKLLYLGRRRSVSY